MFRYVLASAAVLGLLLAGGVGSVSAQTPPAPTATPAPAPTDQKTMKKDKADTSMKKDKAADSSMKKDKAADSSKKMDKSDKQQAMAKPKKENTKLDEVAEKLNSCQAKSQSERQACMDAALKTN